MAARLLLFGIACSLGLIRAKSIGGELGLRLGTEPPREVTAGRGRAVQLPCGPPSPGTSVVWLKNDQPLSLDQRVWQAGNGSLVFNKIVHKKKGVSDAGEYRCLVKNKNGALLSRISKLIVPGLAHEFTTWPESRTVNEGDVLRLTCSIESSPPALITWLKDSQPLPHTKRFTTLDSGVLYISNVKPEDAGNYSCEAHNNHVKKIPRSEAGVLSVVDPAPHPLAFLPDSPASEVTGKAGKSIVIPCAVTGLPKPTVIWYQTKADGTNTSITQPTNHGLNVLKLNKLSHAQHTGTYTCTATHTTKDNTITIFKNVVVIVETPAVIVEKPKTQIYPTAKTVRVDCEVKGYPQPQVVWFKDGERLVINGRIKQNNRQLVIGGVVSQDTGIYQCFAGPDVWAAGRLQVNASPDQPLPPTNLTCTPLSPTQIQLSWSGQPGVQAYSIHYFPTDGGEEGKEVSPNDTYTVQKLQPYTNYTFYLRAYGRSASEQSQRVVCSTGESVPSGGPQVNITITGSQCLLVNWSPPPLAKARGTITSYKVQWKRHNQSSVNFELLPPHINQYRISGLKPGERYMVRVMGATALGFPDFTDSQDWINVTLPLTSPSTFPPPSLSISPLNSTAIRVDWRYSDAFKIDGFILSYKQVGKDITGNTTLPANSTTYVISKLESGSWYDVSMKAFFGDKHGEDCSETVLVGGDSALPAPSLTEAVPLSPSSIRVSWRPPSHAFVTQYTLELASGGRTFKTLVVNSSMAEITNLNGNTVYEVRVKAHGPMNETSAFSLKLECRTPPYVVEAVRNVQLEVVNSSSVLVKWSPLHVPIIGYEILFTKDLAAPIDLYHTRSASSNQTSIMISGLRSDTRYVLKVRGVSSAGSGPLSSNILFKMPMAEGTQLPGTHKPHISEGTNWTHSVIIGLGISAVFVLVCSALVILRRRCMKSTQQPNQHEMATLTHLHTKVGVHNGQMNGLKLFPNVRLPNGHTALRITENPQCETEESAGGSRREGDPREGDSLLNDTQSTTIDLSHNAG